MLFSFSCGIFLLHYPSRAVVDRTEELVLAVLYSHPHSPTPSFFCFCAAGKGMSRRSSRIEEMREKNEVSSCMWGLFSILESCQGRPIHKVISNGRPANRQIKDYPRKLLDPVASFDEECRKIHNRAGVRSAVLVDAKCRNERNCIDKHNSKQDARMDVDRLVKTYTRTRRSSREAYQSSSCCLDNAARLITELPSTSAELNKLTLAALLGAVCAQNHLEETKLSEFLQRNIYLDEVDQINIHQVQMRAKAFVDQMFIDRNLALKGRNSGSKSFSDALDLLNSKRNMFMELLPDPDSMLARRLKTMNTSQTDRNSIKSILAANASEYEEGMDATTSAKTGNTKDGFPSSDKIVILKPAPRNARNVACNCSSSLMFHSKPGKIAFKVKTASFSFREIKKKLKHTFGVSKKDNSRSAGKKEKILNKQELKSTRASESSEIASEDDTTRRKLDFSRAKYSSNEEFDVILEAKRHLSTRLSSLNSVEAVASTKSPRTLERILSSPEHELWPFSPRRDSLYVSSAAEMRYSPYNTSNRVTELRSNTEFASCDDQSKSLQTVYAIAEAEARDTNISTPDNMTTNATKNFSPPEARVSGEMLRETIHTSINKHLEVTEMIKAHKCDGITMDSLADTTTNSHQLDTPHENIKYQEEHRSPVSVLELFFVEDANSPPTITLQTVKKQLQPRRLDFDDCSFESHPHHQPDNADSWLEEEEEEEEEEERLCKYVQSIMEASCLNWDNLSEITTLHEELLLQESLFEEVELPPLDCCYDPKLLFDHIHEVLMEIHRFHFCSPAFATPKTRQLPPLAELVLDEILTEAEFYLLATTERRTLDQIVSNDVVKCRWWLDVRLDLEHVVVEISEAVLEESLLDTLVQFCT